ncbi:MAG: NUDIX domain-containing protein [Proteobacteria bacterium]|nr:NUDIX domain-containing protein [Pseudomonadota bacterium]
MGEPFWHPSWQQEAVEIKLDNFVHQGFYKLKALELRHKCFSGEWSPWLKREQFYHSDASAVLLVDPDAQKLVLVEQFRVGLLQRPNMSPWILEVVAGLVEAHEKPEHTMLREAKEEANCDIKAWIKIGEYYNSPGGFAEKTTLFCAMVDSTDKAGIQGMMHEHEDIKVHVIDIQKALNALSEGQWQTSSSTVIAMQWLAINLNKHPFLGKVHGKTSI